MYLALWQLAQESKEAEVMNNILADNNVPPLFNDDSPTRSFRQAWVKFSSVHDQRYQAHRISDEEIAVVDKTIDDTSNILDLNHVGSIYIREHNKGNVSVYHKCYPKVCGHTRTLETVTTNICPQCNREIPEIAYAIIKEFKKRAGHVSTQTRSMAYSKYVTTVLAGCSFLSVGRPFIVPEGKLAALENFRDALTKIGDPCYILRIDDGKGDEKKLIEHSINSTLEEITKELDEIERPNALENRITKVQELMDKVSLYETVLDVTKDQLLEKASQLKAKISAILQV